MDHLALRGLRARGHHGVLERERDEGQIFVVDVELGLDAKPAADGDDLTKTVDYGVLAEEIAGIVEGEPVDLIETLAERIADACLTRQPVQTAEVVVHKPDAPITVPFDDVTITIKRSRA